MKTKTVFLGMPSYGQVEVQAAEAFYNASHADNMHVLRTHHQGSALVQNFNALWCLALNRTLSGEQVDYFAMLHADVAPAAGWLDILIGELEQQKLDVLSVAMPIKNESGATSAAIDGDDGWHVAARITQYELARLPKTFTAKDIGRPLLFNTGCWVCRFDQDWVREYTPFMTRDAIAFDRTQQRYIAQFEPEDWFFSRLCNSLGLSTGVTSKVPATHVGSKKYFNCGIWGSPYDEANVSASLIPEVDQDGFRYPADVKGWLTYDEGKALHTACDGKRVLEIGSYCGKSTICIAQTAESVDCVDWWDGRGTTEPFDTDADWLANIERYGLAEKVTKNYPTDELLGTYDVIFIDGAHDKESVEADIEKALPLLADDGVILFHDYRAYPGEHDGRWDPDVTLAVEDLLASGAVLLATHGTIAAVQPPTLETVGNDS